MFTPTRDELATLQAAALAAAGLTPEEAPRVCASCKPDGGVEFSFFGPPPSSAHLAHVIVDAVGVAESLTG